MGNRKDKLEELERQLQIVINEVERDEVAAKLYLEKDKELREAITEVKHKEQDRQKEERRIDEEIIHQNVEKEVERRREKIEELEKQIKEEKEKIYNSEKAEAIKRERDKENIDNSRKLSREGRRGLLFSKRHWVKKGIRSFAIEAAAGAAGLGATAVGGPIAGAFVSMGASALLKGAVSSLDMAGQQGSDVDYMGAIIESASLLGNEHGMQVRYNPNSDLSMMIFDSQTKKDLASLEIMGDAQQVGVMLQGVNPEEVLSDPSMLERFAATNMTMLAASCDESGAKVEIELMPSLDKEEQEKLALAYFKEAMRLGLKPTLNKKEYPELDIKAIEREAKYQLKRSGRLHGSHRGTF